MNVRANSSGCTPVINKGSEGARNLEGKTELGRHAGRQLLVSQG